MLKRTGALAALLCLAAGALAQTSTVTPREDRGYQPMRGTSNVGKPVTTEKACEEAIAAEVLVRKKTELYKCRHETVKLGTYSNAPAPVVCDPQPTPTVATMACPAPLVGTWQQTTTVAIGPAPTCTRTVTLTPAAAPAGACTQPPVDPPPVAGALYFSPTGSNSNPGTQASPKRDLGGINLNNLPAGAQLLFQRGGTWAWSGVVLFNRNSTAAAPLVFGDYGTGALPKLEVRSGLGFYIGDYNSQSLREGFVTLRNLHIDGMGTGETALMQGWMTQGITVEGSVVERFTIGMNIGVDTDRFTLRNSVIRNNIQHGVLGAGADWTVEGNRFERNGDARAPGTHALYFSAHLTTPQSSNDRLTVRNNVFRNNSQSGGQCMSGNFTVHGRVVGALIEGNTFSADRFGWGCAGISITAGYGEQEYFRQFVVRNNRLQNVGLLTWSAAPGIVIQGNTVTDTVLRQGNNLIAPSGNNSGGGDDADNVSAAQGQQGNTLCQRADCALVPVE